MSPSHLTDRPAVDPVKLDRLGEVAIRIGLQLRKARIW